MNALDLIVVVLLVIAGFAGYRRGLALQAFGLLGLVIGFAVGAWLAPAVASAMESPTAQATAATVTLITAAGLGDGLGWLIGIRVRDRVRGARLGRADAVGGALISTVATLLAVWFLALNLVNGPFTGVADGIRGSAIVRVLDDALPEPPSLLGQVRRFFNRFGFPDVFSGIPPLPAEPVEPPERDVARGAFSAARASIVRIVGEGCGGVQEGSGFVAANGYVVTNAHVVAGIDAPLVQNASGASQPATTVLFDPDLDLAILRVPASPGPVLQLSVAEAARGDAGAILGYPGGGPLSGKGAAVLRTLDALGRDIYGTADVERSVLELQTTVRPGNSGGPFVLADGTVGGVVFAASTTDERIGYAIAADEVIGPLGTATRLGSAVDTGACVR